MYSVDWTIVGAFSGAAATLIGVVAAICISNKWKKQKSIEIMATESRILIDDLLTLDSLFFKRYNIYQGKDNIAIDTSDDSIKEFQLLINKIKRRLDFLDSSLKAEAFINAINDIDKNLKIKNTVKRALAVSIDYQASNKYENVKKEIDELIKFARNIAQYKNI